MAPRNHRWAAQGHQLSHWRSCTLTTISKSLHNHRGSLVSLAAACTSEGQMPVCLPLVWFWRFLEEPGEPMADIKGLLRALVRHYGVYWHSNTPATDGRPQVQKRPLAWFGTMTVKMCACVEFCLHSIAPGHAKPANHLSWTLKPLCMNTNRTDAYTAFVLCEA